MQIVVGKAQSGIYSSRYKIAGVEDKNFEIERTHNIHTNYIKCVQSILFSFTFEVYSKKLKKRNEVIYFCDGNSFSRAGSSIIVAFTILHRLVKVDGF